MTRRRRSRDLPHRHIPNGDSLDELGKRIDAGAPTAATGAPASTSGLDELGRQIETKRGRHSYRRRRRRTRRVVIGSVVAVSVLIAAAAGGSWYYTYEKYKALQNPTLCGTVKKVCDAEIPGKPFNVLVIGSDSRAGLTGPVAAETGAGSVSGQRSDVVRIFHVNPQAGTISVVSIPRDTVVTLLANQGLYGNYNRINVNYSTGPALLVRTIEANFGIPINHVVQVGFGGLIGAVDALGGIYMYFPYPSLDHYSSLNIPHTGCQLINGVQALAVARSRHFEYFQNGYWQYDGTSDFGRIDRQDQFMRALLLRSESLGFDPLNIANFLSAIPKGIQIDDTFGYEELVGLALKFRHFNPKTLAAYTLPTYGVNGTSLGDVLFVDQPAAQQLLVKVFGQVGTLGGLAEPTNPPPTQYYTTPEPPAVATPTVPHHPAHAHVTTTAPLHTEPEYTFNPTACTPK
jgi:LCP family protein required for cell wall assembly